MSPDDVNDAERRAFGRHDAPESPETSRLEPIRPAKAAAPLRAPAAREGANMTQRQAESVSARRSVKTRAAEPARRGDRLLSRRGRARLLFQASGVAAGDDEGCGARRFVPS